MDKNKWLSVWIVALVLAAITSSLTATTERWELLIPCVALLAFARWISKRRLYEPGLEGLKNPYIRKGIQILLTLMAVGSIALTIAGIWFCSGNIRGQIFFLVVGTILSVTCGWEAYTLRRVRASRGQPI
jgi:hypothetical protein